MSISLCYKCKPANQLLVRQLFCLFCWSSAFVLIPPQEGKRGQKRDSGGFRICPPQLLLPPRTKGPCCPHPTPPLQWPRTHQGHLSIPSQHLARLKSSCLLCSNWDFACYTYLVQWNMTPRLGNPSSLGDNLGWLDIHSWHCSTLAAIFFHLSPSCSLLTPQLSLRAGFKTAGGGACSSLGFSLLPAFFPIPSSPQKGHHESVSFKQAALVGFWSGSQVLWIGSQAASTL